MITTPQRLVASLPGLLAVAFVLFVPAAVQAQPTVIFRNECRASIIVQTSTVIRGNVVRDQPNLLRAGDVTPKIKLDADKIITVYDAKSNMVLFRDVLKVTKTDIGYSIQADPKLPNKVRLYPRKPTPQGFMEGKLPD